MAFLGEKYVPLSSRQEPTPTNQCYSSYNKKLLIKLFNILVDKAIDTKLGTNTRIDFAYRYIIVQLVREVDRIVPRSIRIMPLPIDFLLDQNVQFLVTRQFETLKPREGFRFTLRNVKKFNNIITLDNQRGSDEAKQQLYKDLRANVDVIIR